MLYKPPSPTASDLAGSRATGRSTLPWLPWAGLGVLLTAATSLFLRAGEPFRFNHALHLENGAECATCHETREGGNLLPEKKVCLDCHEEKDLPPSLAGARLAWLGEEILFSHAKHAGRACVDCHSGIEKGDRVRLEMARCQACHQEAAAKITFVCASCHREISELAPPSTHGDTWQAEHGAVVKQAAPSRTAERCDLCHREAACQECHRKTRPADHGEGWRARHKECAGSDPARCQRCHDKSSCKACHEKTRPASHTEHWKKVHGRQAALRGRESCGRCHEIRAFCEACHREEKPSDHGEFWRHRGHGLAVRVDRERCAACHQESECLACHQEAAPRSHRGTWGSSGNQHCRSCHFPASEEGCYVCHKAMPGHAEADRIPGGHSLTSDCRACHTHLPHPDSGDACTSCHRK